MIREAAGVGILLFDFSPRLIHQQPVQNVRSLVDCCRDVLSCERPELVGDVGVGLQAGLLPIFRVDKIHRLAMPRCRKELTVA